MEPQILKDKKSVIWCLFIVISLSRYINIVKQNYHSHPLYSRDIFLDVCAFGFSSSVGVCKLLFQFTAQFQLASTERQIFNPGHFNWFIFNHLGSSKFRKTYWLQSQHLICFISGCAFSFILHILLLEMLIHWCSTNY